MIVRAFRGLRVDAEAASRVAAPPYDVMSVDEAREFVGDNQDSFFHVSMPEIDFPPGTDARDAEVQASGRAALDRLDAEGLLHRDPDDCLYLYRVTMGEHVQTGIVTAASVAAYLDGRIKRHEHTKAPKVEDRARNADVLGAHTGTIFLTYRAEASLSAKVAALAAAAPDVVSQAEDGVRHELWVIAEESTRDALVDAVNAMPSVYIADGHHRSAAAARLAEIRDSKRAAGENVSGADWFLAVLFPDTEVRILPYNRLVATLGDGDAANLLDRLADDFEVSLSPTAVEPAVPGEFGFYAEGQWHRLVIKRDRVPDDAVGRLDINLLEQYCLKPLLGIEDQRTDKRIDFVGGIRGVAELERRVDNGDFVGAFSLYRTGLDDLFAVADAGEVMPPKSTWFEPKLRDGLVILPLDD
ncbi:MAG: DUF1015 family protein [Acidobacteria bacterium]|nr:DUF1015 family protein [Acidobacteriota bacterium]